MSTEQIKVKDTILPGSLSDKELIRFAYDLFYTRGLPSDFQHELIKRFEALVNK